MPLYDKKMMKPMALALSLPSTILFTAWGLMHLVKEGLLNRYIAISLFLLIIFNTFFLMLRYGRRKKN